MPSPGLPLVSPLIHHAGISTGYFPPSQGRPSELEAISHPDETLKNRRQSSIAISSDDDNSDESLVIMDAPPKMISKFQGSIPASAMDPEVIEDEDMYGASADIRSPPGAEEGTLPLQTARDALDALEEFLHISPTLPDFSNSTQRLGQESSHGTLAKEQSLTEAEDIQECSTIQQSLQIEPPIVGLDHRHQNDVSPGKQRSHSIPLDGTVDEVESGLQHPEQAKNSQDMDVNGDGQVREVHQEDLAEVAQAINLEVKPKVDKAIEALGDQPRHLPPPPSPPATQDHDEQIIPPLQAPDLSHLPTPENTQEANETPVKAQDSSDWIEVDMTPADQSSLPKQSRRVAGRLVRKSNTTESVSSPYFNPRKSLDTLPPPTTETETKVPESSPQSELPTSSPTHLTRRQKASLEHKIDEEHDAELPFNQGNVAKSGIRTAHSYYPRLCSIGEHFTKLIDIIAVAVDSSTAIERAKSGPKDYHTTLRLVDMSLDSSKPDRTSAQIFRPYKKAIPTYSRGDVVILRDFRVQTSRQKWMLMSTDSSAWAVCRMNPDSPSELEETSITGPPIQYGSDEITQIKKLARWWHDEGAEAFPALRKKPAPVVTNGEPSQQQQNQQSPVSTSGEQVLDSIEPPPVSPRRTRQRKSVSRDLGTDGTAEIKESPLVARETSTPSAVRQQPARQAKSKTPAYNGQAASPTQSVPEVQASPSTRTKRTQKSPSVPMSVASSNKSKETQYSGVRTRGMMKSPSVVHELRDGKEYIDPVDAVSQTQGVGLGVALSPSEAPDTGAPEMKNGNNKASRRKSSAKASTTPNVHELRDGVKYVDPQVLAQLQNEEGDPTSNTGGGTGGATTRAKAKAKAQGKVIVHELRDGKDYVDVDP
jgi:hypothetical protein